MRGEYLAYFGAAQPCEACCGQGWPCLPHSAPRFAAKALKCRAGIISSLQKVAEGFARMGQAKVVSPCMLARGVGRLWVVKLAPASEHLFLLLMLF
jgi:hypothetical protein